MSIAMFMCAGSYTRLLPCASGYGPNVLSSTSLSSPMTTRSPLTLLILLRKPNTRTVEPVPGLRGLSPRRAIPFTTGPWATTTPRGDLELPNDAEPLITIPSPTIPTRCLAEDTLFREPYTPAVGTAADPPGSSPKDTGPLKTVPRPATITRVPFGLLSATGSAKTCPSPTITTPSRAGGADPKPASRNTVGKGPPAAEPAADAFSRVSLASPLMGPEKL